MQTVIGMQITEKKPPTDRQLERRLAKRKTENAEKAAISEKEAELTTLKERCGSRPQCYSRRRSQGSRRPHPALRKTLTESEEGIQELARIAAASLLERPATKKRKTSAETAAQEEEDLGPVPETRDEEIARLDKEAGKEPGEERPRRRRSRSGGGSGSGGGRGEGKREGGGGGSRRRRR